MTHAASLRKLAALLLTLVPLQSAGASDNRTLAITQTAVNEEQRVALLIGNGNYISGTLGENPVNDASDVAAKLRGLGFDVILATDARLPEMEAKVQEFGSRLARGGVGLFFYAGHGLQVKGENYLVPVDAEIANEAEVKYRSLSLNMVLDTMSDAGNRLNIVMLDACRNNPFTRGFRSGSSGLSPVNASDSATGMVIAFATAPGKTAANGDGRNGLWTSHLLRALSGSDTRITSVLQATTEGVWTSTGGEQKPWLNQSFIGEFWFDRQQQSDASFASTGAAIPMQVATAPAIADTSTLAMPTTGRRPAPTTTFLPIDRHYPPCREDACRYVHLKTMDGVFRLHGIAESAAAFELEPGDEIVMVSAKGIVAPHWVRNPKMDKDAKQDFLSLACGTGAWQSDATDYQCSASRFWETKKMRSVASSVFGTAMTLGLNVLGGAAIYHREFDRKAFLSVLRDSQLEDCLADDPDFLQVTARTVHYRDITGSRDAPNPRDYYVVRSGDSLACGSGNSPAIMSLLAP